MYTCDMADVGRTTNDGHDRKSECVRVFNVVRHIVCLVGGVFLKTEQLIIFMISEVVERPGMFIAIVKGTTWTDEIMIQFGHGIPRFVVRQILHVKVSIIGVNRQCSYRRLLGGQTKTKDTPSCFTSREILLSVHYKERYLKACTQQSSCRRSVTQSFGAQLGCDCDKESMA